MIMDKEGNQVVQLKKFESDSRIVKFKKTNGQGLEI